MRNILIATEFTSGVILEDTLTTDNPAIKAFSSFPKGDKNDCFFLCPPRQEQFFKEHIDAINKERPPVLTLKGDYAYFKAADPHKDIVYKAPDTIVVTLNPQNATTLLPLVLDILDRTSEVTTDTPLLNNERLIFDSVFAGHETGQAAIEARNWRKEWLTAYFNDDLFFGRRIDTIKHITLTLL